MYVCCGISSVNISSSVDAHEPELSTLADEGVSKSTPFHDDSKIRHVGFLPGRRKNLPLELSVIERWRYPSVFGLALTVWASMARRQGSYRTCCSGSVGTMMVPTVWLVKGKHGDGGKTWRRALCSLRWTTSTHEQSHRKNLAPVKVQHFCTGDEESAICVNA